jgi:hypothetical protein
MGCRWRSSWLRRESRRWSLGQLLDRLDHRFALLTGGDRTAAARQRSLAATADWSYQLLSERDRRVFRRLAMFPAPFTLDAAEAVAGAAAELAVLHLVDCSLLVPPQPGPDGRPRYAMLETLRAFGLRPVAGKRAAGAAGTCPGIRWRWPSRPRPVWNPVPESRPLLAGWTPKTPPSTRP